MPAGRKPTLSPEEARRLHAEALVIDAQQPPATSGFLFTESMRAALGDYLRQDGRPKSRTEIAPVMEAMAAREIQTSEAARRQYLDLWRRGGVTVACGTYSSAEPPAEAFDRANAKLARAHAVVDALGGDLQLVRRAADIEHVHAQRRHGLVLDFQNTIAIADKLERVEHFYNLGVRMVQLTYNLRNLVGDGCTEAYQGGLSYFGRELVRTLNDFRILVDVSHCSEQVGWDALGVSRAPVIVSHSASKTVCLHDRNKSDALAKAIADRGGFFGVVVVAGFISPEKEPTPDAFADHVEHLVSVMGIDHVGIGTDKAGPGPGTESLVEYPKDLPRHPPGFNWAGFRLDEHRLTPEYHLRDYDSFADWPKLTVALAARGFNEEELRKLLGLNYLRVFRDVVG